MAVPSVVFSAVRDTGSPTATSLSGTPSNTYSELVLASLAVQPPVTAPTATVGGAPMTLLGSWTHPNATIQLHLFVLPVTGAPLVSPAVNFAWTGAARAAAVIAEMNDIDELAADFGLSGLVASSGTSASLPLSATPAAAQRWLSVMANRSTGVSFSADADWTHHNTSATSNATVGNNVRTALDSRAGSGAPLSDAHALTGSNDWLLVHVLANDVGFATIVGATPGALTLPASASALAVGADLGHTAAALALNARTHSAVGIAGATIGHSRGQLSLTSGGGNVSVGAPGSILIDADPGTLLLPARSAPVAVGYDLGHSRGALSLGARSHPVIAGASLAVGPGALSLRAGGHAIGTGAGRTFALIL